MIEFDLGSLIRACMIQSCSCVQCWLRWLTRMGLIGRPGPHSMDERGPTAPGCPLPAFKLSNCDRILQHWAQRSRAEEVRPQ